MEYMRALFVVMKMVRTKRWYGGLVYKIADVLTIVVCGCLCGLDTLKKIHSYAKSDNAKEMFEEVFKINRIPSYSQMTRLMNIVDTDSLNEMFSFWSEWMARQLEPDCDKIVSFDGKVIKSTVKMKSYEKAIHILSAISTKSGITLGQLAISEKSNEIPALRELIKLLDISGCTIVADALHCQKATCEAIIDQKADYVLPVKENQPCLLENIKEIMDSDTLIDVQFDKTFEKNRDRLEQRTAWTLNDVSGIRMRDDWKNLTSVGMIVRSRYVDGKFSSETHYYISSKRLTPQELIKYTRNEWAVETMHYLLDVTFDEDRCRLQHAISQKNLNVIRKMALNCIKGYKIQNDLKMAISGIMFDCLLSTKKLLALMGNCFKIVKS